MITRIRFLCILVCLFGSLHAFGQVNYRVQRLDKQYYTVPPHAKLKTKNKRTVVRDNSTYYYIRIKGLSGNLRADITRLNAAETWQGSTDYFSHLSKSKIYSSIKTVSSSNGCTCPITTKSLFNSAFLKEDGSTFFLQINFKQLTSGTIETNWHSLETELFKSMVGYEGSNVCGCGTSIKWPTTLSQEILMRLKKWIPVPVNAVQPGLCYTKKTDQSYFMLLNPDIRLAVDVTVKVEGSSRWLRESLMMVRDSLEKVERSKKVEGLLKTVKDSLKKVDSKFYYEWAGVKQFSFGRSKDGKIIQNEFSVFNNGLPDNKFATSQAGSGIYKIASFADVQASDALKDLPYIALFHPPLKQNNDYESSPGGYTPDDNASLITGNPFLLHFLSAELQQLDFEQYFGESDLYTKSIFGQRGSIKPLIEIFINGKPEYIGIERSSENITQLPANFRLYRKYGSKYRLVKGKKNFTYFLPNDHIKYTL